MNKVIAKLKTFDKGAWIKTVTTALALSFALFSIIYFTAILEFDDMALSFLSIVYILTPIAVERIFRFRIQPFIIAYTICPLLGSSYRLYLHLSWWDDMLHGFAGVIFAMFGAYLPRFGGKKASIALCALMAFVFSIAVAGFWELIEYGWDTIFGSDMQKDTWVTGTRPSYYLGKILGLPDGMLADAGNSKIVTIIQDANGNTIEKVGYLDTGLLDTMGDMLIETLGALVYTVIYVIGKGKKFVFVPVEETQKTIIDQSEQEILQEVASAELTNESADETPAVKTE